MRSTFHTIKVREIHRPDKAIRQVRTASTCQIVDASDSPKRLTSRALFVFICLEGPAKV